MKKISLLIVAACLMCGLNALADTYTITTAAEWNALVTDDDGYAGDTIYIANDIDFGSTSIQALGSSTAFAGEIDGNGKTLTVTYASSTTKYGSLAITADTTAYIHDLTLAGSYDFTANYNGGAVGSLYGKIENVTIKGTVTAAGYCGGLVGYVYGGGVVSGCTFEGTMTNSATYSAGLVAYVHDGGTVTSCVNNGTVTSSSLFASGVVGYVASGGTVTSCVNNGTVTSSTNYASGVVGYVDNGGTVTDCGTGESGSVTGADYVAGTVAYITGANAVISACYNKGTITGTSSYTGGVVGSALSNAKVTGCYNAGTVTSSNKYVGGVIASASSITITGCYNDSTATVTISDNGYGGGAVGYLYSSEASECHNYGTVNTTGTYTGGVFGYTLTSNVISNCCNYGTVSSTSTYSGGVIGYTNDNEVSNCFNYGAVESAGTYPSGVIGYSYTGNVVVNCGNYGSVTYTGSTTSCYASGCIGRAYYGTYTKVFNEGTVSATSSSANYISGVFGYLYSSSTAYVITDCYNTADITANGYVAGLITNVYTSTGVTMTNCYNTGNITSTSTATSTYPTAGLIAYYPKGSTFTNCWNSGTITSNGLQQTGGLFGARKNANNSSYPITIKGCYNTGNIVSAGDIVGGLIGVFQSDYSTIDSCYNTGNVTGGKYTGGIIGNLYGDEVQVTNCWNSGDVISPEICVGGCFGQSFVKVATITNCFNAGDVTSTSTYVGGVIGRSSASLFNTYNTGTVTGSQYVGGVVGIPYSTTIISGAYSTGKVVATADSAAYFGNIIGISTTDTTVWTSDYEITNAYYLSTNASSDAQEDNLSTALSYAQLGALQLPDSAWTAGDNYTYPRLTTLADNDYAKAYAAAVIPADGDSYSSITTGFNVGTPDGVTWTASSGSVEIDGNNVTFSESFSGTLTMTATSGDVSVATELTCNVVVSGISDITGASREVVSETFYNLAGAQVAEPAEDSKAIYIVVKSYSDGTTETVKEVR